VDPILSRMKPSHILVPNFLKIRLYISLPPTPAFCIFRLPDQHFVYTSCLLHTRCISRPRHPPLYTAVKQTSNAAALPNEGRLIRAIHATCGAWTKTPLATLQGRQLAHSCLPPPPPSVYVIVSCVCQVSDVMQITHRCGC